MTISTTNSPSTPWRIPIPRSSINSSSTRIAAQNADETTKPIEIVFSLIGLYLHIEKGFTGKQVQRAHMQLAKWPNTWAKPTLPASRGTIRIEDVLAVGPGPARDAMIERWCASVWMCWQANRTQIMEVARKYLEVA